MADELRTDAVVGDGFTSPLQALNKLLTQVGANPAGKQVTKDWQGVSGAINKVALDIRSGLQPVMSGLGIASLGVSGAITGIGLAVKNFALNTDGLSRFSRQIGLSVDQLRQLKAVGERFGIDWNQAQGSLKQFATYMDQIQRNAPGVRGQLRAMGLGNFVEELLKAPNMQAALDKTMSQIKSIKNPVRARELAQIFFGSDELATVARELTPTMLAEIKKMTASITPEMEASSKKFVDNWFKMQQAVDNFVVKGIGPAMEPINNLINAVNRPIGDELKKSFDDLNRLLKTFSEFKKSWQDGNYLDALGKLDRETDMGIGPRHSRESLQAEIDAKQRQQQEARERGDFSAFQKLGNDIRALREAIERLRREAGATVQQQSFGGFGDWGGARIMNAALRGAGGGISPFGGGFWADVYRGGVGGDPFRGAGRTWDQPGGGGAAAGAPRAPGAGRGGVTNAPPLNPDVSPGSGINRPRAIDVGPGRQTDPSNPIKGFANLMRGQYGAPGENLVTIKTPSGRTATVHREAAEAFKGFLADLEGAGYKVNSLGGYRLRGQANGSGKLSQHAYGNAIDINPGANPYMRSQTDMPKNVSDMAAKWGLSWGGDWSARFRDPMHFEWTGARPWENRPGPTPTADNRPSGPGMPFGLTGDRLAEIERRRDALSGVRRTGDSMMGRAFGAGGVAAGAPKIDATGSVSIHLSGGLEKAPARVSMDGLFKDVQVNRKVQVPGSRDVPTI